jgi:hypothetical protein
MEPFWIGLFAWAWTLETFAQGYLGFTNHAAGAPYYIDAPVFDTDCRTRLPGPAYLSEFYAGLTLDALRPSGQIEPFNSGPGAGYVQYSAMQWDDPAIWDGTIFQVQMRAWQASAGPSFEAAVASGGKFGFSNLVPEALRLAPGPTEFPVGLRSFCLMQPLGQEPRLKISATTRPLTLEVDVIGRPEWSVVLQTSSDLMSWAPLATNVLSGALWIYQDQPAEDETRFYRVLLQEAD